MQGAELEENIPLDRDFLHRRCISLHSACWSVCRQCCPCPSPHPLTPSGSTETARAYWKRIWSMCNPKIHFVLWLITKSSIFQLWRSSFLSQVFFSLHFFLRSISVLTSLYPHGELCLPLNGGNGVFNNFTTAHGKKALLTWDEQGQSLRSKQWDSTINRTMESTHCQWPANMSASCQSSDFKT